MRKTSDSIWLCVFILFVNIFLLLSILQHKQGCFVSKYIALSKAVLIIDIAFLVKTSYQAIRSACKTTSTEIGKYGVIAR